jgi:Cu-processing system permease protein
MSIRLTMQIARYGMRDLLRSRWVLGYAGFFALATFALLRFSDSETKALLSLTNVVLLVVPLANILFGTMYLYASREFVELLLAQPVRRRELFGGLLLGLVAPVMLAVTAGIGVPLAFARATPETMRIGFIIAGIAAGLGAVFTTIASAIAYWIEDRVRGLATAIGVWLILAIIYDALVLLAAVQFADYPLERPMLVAMFTNPVDLARLLLLTRFDAAALLGYTGALFQSFLGGAIGLVVAAGALAAWIVGPAFVGMRRFLRKDF